jgi:predicted nuclease of predicted toxin-antitoxin system
MKLLIDENVSRRIVERLQEDGHTIILGQQVARGVSIMRSLRSQIIAALAINIPGGFTVITTSGVRSRPLP